MPIEVHCPNPDCARVHQVKNKYAGMRGKCPICGSWMFVPTTGQMPSEVGMHPPRHEEPTAWKQESVGEVGRAEHHLPLREEARQPAGVDAKTEATVRKRFSGTAALLLVLGILSLGGVATTPFLEAGEVVASEDFVKDYGSWKLQGIKEENRLLVMAVPAGVAVLALLGLFAGPITGRSGFLSLLLVYTTALLSAGLLFLVLFVFHEEVKNKQDFADAVANRQADGMHGEATFTLGQYLWAGLGGASGASAFFILAAVVMHRRWWSQMIGFLFLAGVLSLAAVWLYRTELGIPGIVECVFS